MLLANDRVFLPLTFKVVLFLDIASSKIGTLVLNRHPCLNFKCKCFGGKLIEFPSTFLQKWSHSSLLSMT